MAIITALNTMGENSLMDTFIPKIEQLLLHYQPRSPRGGEVVAYETVSGTATGEGIWKNSKSAVQISYLSADLKFVRHLHDEYETFVPIVGRLFIVLDNKEVILKPGESLTLRPGVKHHVYTKEYTEVLVITVPGAAGFPDGPE